MCVNSDLMDKELDLYWTSSFKSILDEDPFCLHLPLNSTFTAFMKQVRVFFHTPSRLCCAGTQSARLASFHI